MYVFVRAMGGPGIHRVEDLVVSLQVCGGAALCRVLCPRLFLPPTVCSGSMSLLSAPPHARSSMQQLACVVQVTAVRSVVLSAHFLHAHGLIDGFRRCCPLRIVSCLRPRCRGPRFAPLPLTWQLGRAGCGIAAAGDR
jgi:hypothetical protein